MKLKPNLQAFFILFILSCCSPYLYAQKTLIQFDSSRKIQFGKFGIDSLTVMLQITRAGDIFPATYFVKGKLKGDKTMEIKVPDSLKQQNSSWTFLEYIATADNSGMYIKPQVYAGFEYSPFNYEFKTNPPNADVYIVPLINWKALFKREDIGFAFKASDLPLLADYKILVPSPCNYNLFEQPYVGVFVLGEKIKMEKVNPKRKDPLHNKADIQFQ